MVTILGKNESIQEFQNRERSIHSNTYSYISLGDKNESHHLDEIATINYQGYEIHTVVHSSHICNNKGM